MIYFTIAPPSGAVPHNLREKKNVTETKRGPRSFAARTPNKVIIVEKLKHCLVHILFAILGRKRFLNSCFHVFKKALIFNGFTTK